MILKIPKHLNHANKKCDVVNNNCFKLKCFRAHDCGYTNTIGKWISNICCVTRFNNGCPNILEEVI